MILKNPPLHHVGIVQPDEETALSLMALLGLSEVSRGSVETEVRGPAVRAGAACRLAAAVAARPAANSESR